MALKAGLHFAAAVGREAGLLPASLVVSKVEVLAGGLRHAAQVHALARAHRLHVAVVAKAAGRQGRRGGRVVAVVDGEVAQGRAVPPLDAH